MLETRTRYMSTLEQTIWPPTYLRSSRQIHSFLLRLLPFLFFFVDRVYFISLDAHKAAVLVAYRLHWLLYYIVHCLSPVLLRFYLSDYMPLR